MKRVVSLLLLIMLVGCGKVSEQDVKQQLSEKLASLQSYQLTGVMTMHTGETPVSYAVKVKYKGPEWYRVDLANDDGAAKQVMLRNEQGVYVVHPALNKAYQFQNDWPKTGSHIYLYDAIVRDIVSDKKGKVTEKKNHWLFEVKTNYKHKTLVPIQQILVRKTDLVPVEVHLLNEQRKTLVSMKISSIQFGVEWSKQDFMWSQSEEKTTTSSAVMPIFYPRALGQLQDEQEMAYRDGKRHIAIYGGDKPFTIVQQSLTAKKPFAIVPHEGELVDLLFTVGVLSNKMIQLAQGNVEYTIASPQMNESELIQMASSMTGKVGK